MSVIGDRPRLCLGERLRQRSGQHSPAQSTCPGNIDGTFTRIRGKISHPAVPHSLRTPGLLAFPRTGFPRLLTCRVTGAAPRRRGRCGRHHALTWLPRRRRVRRRHARNHPRLEACWTGRAGVRFGAGLRVFTTVELGRGGQGGGAKCDRENIFEHKGMCDVFTYSSRVFNLYGTGLLI